MAEIFLDTSFAIAVTVSTDRYHETAMRLARELRNSRAVLVTTHAILAEIGDSFHDRPTAKPQLNSFALFSVILAFLSGRSTRNSSRGAISCSSIGQIRPGASPTAFRLRLCRNETCARLLPPTSILNRRGSWPYCAAESIDRTRLLTQRVADTSTTDPTRTHPLSSTTLSLLIRRRVRGIRSGRICP